LRRPQGRSIRSRYGEIRFHIDMETEENLRVGMSLAEVGAERCSPWEASKGIGRVPEGRRVPPPARAPGSTTRPSVAKLSTRTMGVRMGHVFGLCSVTSFAIGIRATRYGPA
jgi:hypothetical protein